MSAVPLDAAPADEDAARVRVEVRRTHDEEFVVFVQSSRSYLYRTAFLLAGSTDRAEELVQATYERTFRSWRKAREGEPRAYARAILVNLRTDGWRRTRREVVTDTQPVGVAHDHAPVFETRDVVVRALAELPERQRRVVVLRHLLDLTEADTARELGLPLGTVKSANARGLARLRELLTEGGVR